MKLTALFLTLISIHAFACPTFTGSYVCNYDDGPQKMTLSTQTQNGETSYTINGATLKADGQLHQFPNGGSLSISCQNEQLIFKQKLTNQPLQYCQSGTASLVDVLTSWAPKGNDIQEHNEGTVTCSSGEVASGTSDFSCVKQ